MNPAGMNQEQKLRAAGVWLRYGLAMAIAAALAYFASICGGIVHAAAEDQIHSADAIVVFGAAEYSGRPSPVYRARLDHALRALSTQAWPRLSLLQAAAAAIPVSAKAEWDTTI